MLPVSWGGVHSRAALQLQTSSSLMLLGGPGFSAGPESEEEGWARGNPTPNTIGLPSLSWPDPLDHQSWGRRNLNPCLPWSHTNHQDVDGCLGLQAFQLHSELIAA